jgi:DNA-binding transcriptional LysR family regulator
MRSLNLDQLRAFVEVVERGSFTAAARELNLTQPAVTHQIQELERRFKVALVERFGKRAYLTQAGEKLIEHARNLLEEDSRTQVMMRRFGDGWLGRVRVGTSMTVLMYLLPPILRQLKTDHPQLEINLKAGLTATTLQMLKTNALDLGLCAIPMAAHMLVRPLNPRASRPVGLVRLRGKRATEGMELVSAALLSLRRIDLAGEPWRISLNSGRRRASRWRSLSPEPRRR